MVKDLGPKPQMDLVDPRSLQRLRLKRPEGGAGELG